MGDNNESTPISGQRVITNKKVASIGTMQTFLNQATSAYPSYEKFKSALKSEQLDINDADILNILTKMISAKDTATKVDEKITWLKMLAYIFAAIYYRSSDKESKPLKTFAVSVLYSDLKLQDSTLSPEQVTRTQTILENVKKVATTMQKSADQNFKQKLTQVISDAQELLGGLAQTSTANP